MTTNGPNQVESNGYPLAAVADLPGLGGWHGAVVGIALVAAAALFLSGHWRLGTVVYGIAVTHAVLTAGSHPRTPKVEGEGA